MYFFLALLVLPLVILIFWATSLSFLTSIQRERRLFITELALCGVGSIIALALITAPPAPDSGTDVDDWTPLWGWVLLFSATVCVVLVSGLWAFTVARRRQRQHGAPKPSNRNDRQPQRVTNLVARAVRSTVGRHPLLISLAGIIVVFTLVIVPTAHAFFDEPAPPDSVTDAATTFRAALQGTPGIADSSVTMGPAGYGGGGSENSPSAWRISAAVTAEPGTDALHQIADTLHDGLAAAGLVATTTGVLYLTGDGYPDTTFDFDDRTATITTSERIDTGLLLRTVPGTQAVDVSVSAPPGITVASPTQWASTVHALRDLTGFGTGATRTVTVNANGPESVDPAITTITVDRTVPDEATLTGLATVATQAGVATFSYDPVRPPDSSDDWRPTLVVATTTTLTKNNVLGRLSTFDIQAAPAAETPRAAYTVYSHAEEIGSETTGYLGLPQGTVEANDLVPLPEPTLDPAIQASLCSKNEGLIRTLLDAAGDLAGIRVAPVIDTTACDAGSGTQVVGRVTIPIFDIADTADPAYNRIVAAWNAQGYTNKDRAGPLELRTGGPLKLLAISGGPPGITITATSY